MSEEFEWSKRERPVDPNPRQGDYAIVNLPVKVWFDWSDKIVVDYDEDTGETEYASGYVMHIVGNQSFVYNGQERLHLGQIKEEK